MNRVPTKEYLENNGFIIDANRVDKPCPWADENDKRDCWEITISYRKVGNEITFDYFPSYGEWPDLGKAFYYFIISAGFGSYDFEGWLEATDKDESLADDPYEIASWKRAKANHEKAIELLGEEKLIQLSQYYSFVS